MHTLPDDACISFRPVEVPGVATVAALYAPSLHKSHLCRMRTCRLWLTHSVFRVPSSTTRTHCLCLTSTFIGALRGINGDLNMQLTCAL
jgi:hypothetical protein